MAISKIQNSNIHYESYVLRNDNTNVSMPIFQEDVPCLASPAYQRYLETKDLSKKEQIQRGIKQIVKELGLSEKYVKLLMNEEKLHLKVYDDGVKSNENDEHGTYTIGYGHTGSVPGWMFQDEGFDNDKMYEITDENKNLLKINAAMAMELLLEDLKNSKNDAIEYFGEENFNNAPKSIQDAIVDIIFNKGLKAFNQEINPNSPTIKLKEDLENKDYVNAATNTIYETPIMGLKMRNLKRFSHSVQDLNSEEKQAAKEQAQYYYEKVQKDIKRAQAQFGRKIKTYHKWLQYNWYETKASIIWGSINNGHTVGEALEKHDDIDM